MSNNHYCTAYNERGFAPERHIKNPPIHNSTTYIVRAFCKNELEYRFGELKEKANELVSDKNYSRICVRKEISDTISAVVSADNYNDVSQSTLYYAPYAIQYIENELKRYKRSETGYENRTFR